MIAALLLMFTVTPNVVLAARTGFGNDCSKELRLCRNVTCDDFNKNCDEQPTLEGIADGPPSTQSLSDRTRRSPQEGAGVCVLPPYPQYGRYDVVGAPDAAPGQTFDTVRLNITCNPGFIITGKSIVFCISGIWSDDLPTECIRSCRLEKHPSVSYNCILGGNKNGEAYRECDDYEPAGTMVRPECNTNYYNTGVLARMRCLGTAWDYIAVCTPECGRVTSAGNNLIIGGKPAERGEFPWHAGIYRKTTTPFQQICGGSLVSTTAVISAAHCFWDKFEQKSLPASRFGVAVGKLYRPWGDPNDIDAQKSDVSEIIIPIRFKGATTRFQDDIAILKLSTPIQYQTHVLPVCVDFNQLFEKKQLQEGSTGKVAGWGLTAPNGVESPVLRVADMPYVPIVQCVKEAPAAFESYITSDKICAGYVKNGTAVCKGDSGGGLVFPESDRGTVRYYLRGIVSTAPSNDNACNAFAVTSYTQVSAHRSFIEENSAIVGDQAPNGVVPANQIPNPVPQVLPAAIPLDVESVPADQKKNQQNNICIVPPHPENGVYFYTGTPNAFTIQLTTVCDPGYLAEDNNSVYCSYGRWSRKLPRCIQTCKFGNIAHPTVVYNCQIGEVFQTCGDEVPTGTIIHVQCLQSQEGLPPMTCVNGTWDSFPLCITDCGRVKSGSQQGQTELFPWYAHVYQKMRNTHIRICAASLITPTVLVSAANCYWIEHQQKTVPTSKLVVAVGKQYSRWDHPRDTDTQSSDVSKIIVHNYYQGYSTSFINDVAILTVAKAFVYNTKVGPVCVDRYVEIEARHLREGMIGKASIWSENNADAPDLRIVDMPYVKRDKCLAKSGTEFIKYMTHDKFCAGKLDGAKNCKTDLGSGIVFSDIDRGMERYYLRGIVSTAPGDTDNDCYTFPFLTFTRIQSHFFLIKDVINQ